MITRIELKNFTAFDELSLDFSPKINVIIGENATGKTHLLKAAYGLCAGGSMYKGNPETTEAELTAALTAKLLRLFAPLDDKLGKLHRQGSVEHAYLAAEFTEDRKIALTFFNNSKALAITNHDKYEQYKAEAVFIPTKEVLSLVKGMAGRSHDQKTVEQIFDAGYVDLAEALIRTEHDAPEIKVNLDPRLGAILPKLSELMNGRYLWDDGEFCFQPGAYREKTESNRSKVPAAQMYQDSTMTHFVPSRESLLSSNMTAEGFRKIGILQRLLSNESLSPGVSGPLFWDEPESNLNPKIIRLLVDSLLELSRNGQQIILATHDYVLLKWFDLLMDEDKDDHILFHSLYRAGDRIEVASTDDYLKIAPNPIDEAFGSLINREIENDMGGLGK